MRTPLIELLTDLTYQLAHTRRLSIAKAGAQIRQLASVARLEYGNAGAPYGDDDDGFVRWLATPRGGALAEAAGPAGADLDLHARVA